MIVPHFLECKSFFNNFSSTSVLVSEAREGRGTLSDLAPDLPQMSFRAQRGIGFPANTNRRFLVAPLLGMASEDRKLTYDPRGPWFLTPPLPYVMLLLRPL